MITNEGTILVVDDRISNLKVLLSFLKEHQFEIRIADSGERALQVLESYQPDIILLDIMMPGIDGFETCRLIKANKKTADVPVIFISALDDLEDKFTGFEVGGVDYITKPFQRLEVLTRINTHIRLRRKEQELQLALKEVSRQQQLYEQLSITDELTGLYNRRQLKTIIEKEFRRSQRHGSDLSCLMLDLDHFKQINDQYGHDFGDIVLRKFSVIMEESIRSSDFAFRFGGEEFILLLPETNLKGAVEVGEKIRTRMARERIVAGDIDAIVQLSVGISSMLHNHPTSSDTLIILADKALYAAKRDGRNQVCVFENTE